MTVVIHGDPRRTLQPKHLPWKKTLYFLKKGFLIFREMELSKLKKKKVYILLKKVFLIFREMQFSGPKVKKFQKALNSKLERQKNVFIFS